MDIAMKAITSGTLLLSHTIKNEVYKISMSPDVYSLHPYFTPKMAHR